MLNSLTSIDAFSCLGDIQVSDCGARGLLIPGSSKEFDDCLFAFVVVIVILFFVHNTVFIMIFAMCLPCLFIYYTYWSLSLASALTQWLRSLINCDIYKTDLCNFQKKNNFIYYFTLISTDSYLIQFSLATLFHGQCMPLLHPRRYMGWNISTYPQYLGSLRIRVIVERVVM